MASLYILNLASIPHVVDKKLSKTDQAFISLKKSIKAQRYIQPPISIISAFRVRDTLPEIDNEDEKVRNEDDHDEQETNDAALS